MAVKMLPVDPIRTTRTEGLAPNSFQPAAATAKTSKSSMLRAFAGEHVVITCFKRVGSAHNVHDTSPCSSFNVTG